MILSLYQLTYYDRVLDDILSLYLALPEVNNQTLPLSTATAAAETWLARQGRGPLLSIRDLSDGVLILCQEQTAP